MHETSTHADTLIACYSLVVFHLSPFMYFGSGFYLGQHRFRMWLVVDLKNTKSLARRKPDETQFAPKVFDLFDATLRQIVHSRCSKMPK